LQLLFSFNTETNQQRKRKSDQTKSSESYTRNYNFMSARTDRKTK